ncbi:MAG: hypothetical protein IT342_06480 [Candidatus Melainabacteria bacterium]|nr:hypothetical protein [Candidatus Melainabacteria bacterium]
MNTAQASVVETLSHAKAVLGGEISVLINPADRAMVEHLHELILAADLQALECFVRQFSQSAEYLNSIAGSAGKHFAQLVTGLCVNAHAPGVLLINSYHGDFGLLIYANSKPSLVVSIKTLWDGTIQLQHGMRYSVPAAEVILNNCASTARERLARLTPVQVFELPLAVEA